MTTKGSGELPAKARNEVALMVPSTWDEEHLWQAEAHDFVKTGKTISANNSTSRLALAA
jgi:hypothetical protein